MLGERCCYETISVLALALLLAHGCVSAPAVRRYPPDDVIWSPRTEYGRAYKNHNVTLLTSLVQSIQTSPQLGSATLEREGLLVTYRAEEGDTGYYLSVHLTCNVVFNTLQTNYLQRAASAYSRILFPFACILAEHPELLDYERISGVLVWLDWRATNFLEDRYRVFARTEGMNAFVSTPVLREFAGEKISIQELGRRSVFTSTGGRTELDFSNIP
ncbi:MAG: hypothetical protein R6X12_09275 [bacterium]